MRIRANLAQLIFLLLVAAIARGSDAPSDRAALLRGIAPGWHPDDPACYIPARQRAVPSDDDLGNFDRVSARIYRGRQPRLRGEAEVDGVSLLRLIGVTDIINLRGDGDDVARERVRSAQEGIALHSFPLPSWDLGLPVFGRRYRTHQDDVARAIALLMRLEGEGRTVFLHCARGADRTGVVVALYRLLKGAQMSAVLAEAADHELSWMQIGMRNFIKSHTPERLAELRRLVAAYLSAPPLVSVSPIGQAFGQIPVMSSVTPSVID